MEPRHRLIPATVTLALAGTLNACRKGGPEAAFRAHLAATLASQGPATIDLAVAMPIAWDSVTIINPYSSQSAVDSALGFHWDATPISTVLRDDGANALVFVQHGRVQAAIVVKRRDGDFCCEVRNGRYARAAAVFELVQDSLGARLRPMRAGTG